MTQVPPVSAPVCYRHNNRETYIRCTRCDRPICPACMVPASVGHQCPECVALGRRSQRQVRTAFGATRSGVAGYVTVGLIVTNVLLFIGSVVSAGNKGAAIGGGAGGGLLGSNTPLLDRFSVIGTETFQDGLGRLSTFTVGIPDGEYYRLFTAMFMHYGLLHIALNMYALWILGRPLEAMFGPLRFLAIYLVCGLGGNVAAYVFSPGVESAGASTALFGLFGVYFFVLRKLNLSVSTLVPVLVINLVITFTASRYISVAGHLGGLVTGALIGFGLAKIPQQNRNVLQAALLVGVTVVLGLIVLWQTHQLTGAHPSVSTCGNCQGGI